MKRTCYKNYYERESQTKEFWGTQREVALSENIVWAIPPGAGTIAEIGCGDGFLLHKIKGHIQTELYASDLSFGRLKNVKRRIKEVKIVEADVVGLPFKDRSFDVVICSELIEHVPDYEKAIGELVRIARQLVIITVPNEQKLIEVTCPNCDLKHYLSGHVNSFSNGSIVSLLNKKGLKLGRLAKFHTIYTYNKATLKLPAFLRIFIDKFVVRLHRRISFFKPNYMVFTIIK